MTDHHPGFPPVGHRSDGVCPARWHLADAIAPSSRLSLLAAAADAVAVVVFAAVGRLSHGEADDLLGLVATAAPFGVGLVAAWATPVVRGSPPAWRAGAVAVVCVAGIGLLLRAGFPGGSR